MRIKSSDLVADLRKELGPDVTEQKIHRLLGKIMRAKGFLPTVWLEETGEWYRDPISPALDRPIKKLVRGWADGMDEPTAMERAADVSLSKRIKSAESQK